MAGPSLSEFTHIPAEASINPGVIKDGREAVSQLNQSAQFNAEMAQKRYAQNLDRLSGIYKDLGAIQETPVMQQDRPILNKKMADILSTIAEDPRAALGGAKFNEIQRGLGELRTLATTSKQDNVWDEFHRKALESDPELSTPQNKNSAENFANTPLGQREKKPFQTPVKFDPEKAMDAILKSKQVAVPYAETGFAGPNNEFITRATGTTYKRDAALNIWNQGYETGTDANNQPIKKWAQEQFQKLQGDPDQLAKFGNPKDAQELYQNIGKQMYGSNEDIVGEKTSTQTANPYNLLSKRQNFALYMEGIREGNREKLAAVKKNLELQGAPENANFLLKSYANLMGNTAGRKMSVDIGKGKYEDEAVVDIPNNILKNYAEEKKGSIKEGTSLDDVTETITKGDYPDLTTRTKDGNLRLTFYKHYGKNDTLPDNKHVGDVITDSRGNPIIETTGVVPKRSLLTTLGKGVVQTKLLSYSIDVADKALSKDPNAVIDRVNSGEDDEGTAGDKASEVNNPKKPSGKTYSVGGRTFTQDQIEKGAKKYKLSVQDYLKQIGAN